MNMIQAYVIWRLKEGINIIKEDLMYFSPGGYTFTHKSGKHVIFEFFKSSGNYEEEDGILDFEQKYMDDELITEMLKRDKYTELIKETYDIDFFKDGKIDLESSEDEMYCCMDLRIKESVLQKLILISI